MSASICKSDFLLNEKGKSEQMSRLILNRYYSGGKYLIDSKDHTGDVRNLA